MLLLKGVKISSRPLQLKPLQRSGWGKLSERPKWNSVSNKQSVVWRNHSTVELHSKATTEDVARTRVYTHQTDWSYYRNIHMHASHRVGVYIRVHSSRDVLWSGKPGFVTFASLGAIPKTNQYIAALALRNIFQFWLSVVNEAWEHFC